jgi:hypothetical protein
MGTPEEAEGAWREMIGLVVDGFCRGSAEV